MCAATAILYKTQAMQWGHPWTSLRQQTPSAWLCQLQPNVGVCFVACKRLLFKVKTGRVLKLPWLFLSSFLYFLYSRHLSPPFSLFYFDFNILLAFNIFRMSSLRVFLSPSPHSLQLHFLHFPLLFSSTDEQPLTAERGEQKYRLRITVLKCLWKAITINKRPFR